MHNSKIIIFWLFTMAVIPVISFGQVRTDIEEPDQDFDRQVEKQIDPVIKLWYIDGYGAFRDSTKLDTLQDFFHIYNPVYKDAITVSYLGNYGLPYLDNDFFNRQSNMDFFFLKTREAYLLTPEKLKYYNTRTPYTLLDFTQSEHRSRKNETRFNVIHTQNINPFFNFTFRFDQGKSMGQYKNQATNNNFVTLYSNYNNDKISIYGGFITNSIKNNENGGLTDDDLIFDEGDTDFFNVNLTSCKTHSGGSYFFGTGEYRLGKYIEPDYDEDSSEEEEEIQTEFKPFAGILYSFKFQTHKKEFINEEDIENEFFPDRYYGENYTKDSIRFMMIRNIIQLKQYEDPYRKTSFGKRAFIGQEYVHTSFPGPATEVSHQKVKKFSNFYVGGGIFRQEGSFWNWDAEGKLFLLGRNAGQTELSGSLSKPLFSVGDSISSLNIHGKIENLVPDYFQEEFYSNHIRWNHDLKMEQRMTAKGSFMIPGWNMELSANYAIINNYIYNDTAGIPSQLDGQMLVLSAYADKDFNLRNLHFRTRLLWQNASHSQVLHLPAFSTFVSAYYQFVISKVLFSQIGFDTRYNTMYFADNYDPSTGLFYLQDEIKVGGFPYIDVYASVRLKRTRVFFKMMNVGTSFINKAYFTTTHYPMNRMTFRMGFAWSFYD